MMMMIMMITMMIMMMMMMMTMTAITFMMINCRDIVAAAVVDEKDDERSDFSCSWVASCTGEKYFPKPDAKTK